jgi:deoxyribose-phosphate aldolase
VDCQLEAQRYNFFYFLLTNYNYCNKSPNFDGFFVFQKCSTMPIPNLATYIDHTLLRPDALLTDIVLLCREAVEQQFAAVCVPPYFVGNAADILRDSRIKVATVAGFPMGYSPIATKVDEIKRLLDEDADEIDAVVNIAAVKNANWRYVRNDIESMTVATHIKGKVLKLIFETGLLSTEEIIKLCDLCNEIGVNYAKTSTGLLGAGATPDIVKLLRTHLQPTVKIKASGGINTRRQAEALIAAGANRIGSSKGLVLLGK